MEIFNDGQKKLLCPYNSSHEILACRMGTHLTKCRKNYPESPRVPCDFNSVHMIIEPELQYHYEVCPDKKKIEYLVYEEEGACANKFPVRNIEVPVEESWDDIEVPSYDPKKYCESREIIRHLDVESASKRKNFRMEERRRINNLLLNQNQEIPTPEKVPNPVSYPKMPVGVALEENEPKHVMEVIQQRISAARKPFIPGGSK